MPLVFAPLVSDLPVIILVLFILTAVPPVVLVVLQCLGGIFLLYLGFKAFMTLRLKNPNNKANTPVYGNFFKAVFVNILNPNPYLGWSLVMGPMLLKGWSESPKNGIVLLTMFYFALIVYSAVMVILFSATWKLGPRVNRISQIFSVIAFLVFGIYQLVIGIAALHP